MREVRIKDTLTGELRRLDSEEVGIYACGPTVYSRIHIGNARPFVVFSLFAAFLRSEGYRPKLVLPRLVNLSPSYAALTCLRGGRSCAVTLPRTPR